MKFIYCYDSGYCLEFDDDKFIDLSETIPSLNHHPKKLGIIFPCGVKIKKSLCDKPSSIMKQHKPLTKQQNRNVSYLKETKSKNTIKGIGSEECAFPPKTNKPKQDCILYVIDENEFNKVISYAKANGDCEHTVELKGDKSRNGNVKTSDNKKERMFKASLNAGKSLHACKSRELRGGILSTDCFCLRRNGLQYDCRRTGCQNSPLCTVLPAPVCEPSRVACITHCANPHAEELSSICKLRPW